jgi:YdjC-like protein
MTMIPPTQIGSTSCRRPRGTLYLLVAVTALVLPMIARPAERQPELLIRTDDIGMNHSVNTALGKFIAMGVPFSVSVMVACPWFPEAAEILRDNPRVSVGIHLTLNSEWKDYRWGPVLGASRVPTLVDSDNPADPYRVAKHRQAELDAVTSPAFFRELAGRGVHFVKYRDMVARYGRAAMKAPENFEYSMNEPGDR